MTGHNRTGQFHSTYNYRDNYICGCAKPWVVPRGPRANDNKKFTE